MQYQLAQINIAKFRVPMEDPVNRDFVANLDRVNAIAEQQPGFVWRLIGEGENATDIQAYDDPNILVNMSVWADIESLAAFVYRTPAHLDIMRRRREWFERLDIFQALWWVPAGHRPDVAEGRQRLEHLQRHGPTAQAFTFRQPYRSPAFGDEDSPVLDRCA
ncbi:DUF3291 domain-containing protein [Fodinicurvata fenggangensis]|uniref:DUF3291 domain-containing protein n=1 Tax=Fodinicurvata fenggangensis TaxID=1121830 RepID=UPI00047E610A|nr:DUF3291 domain-containing protein [Fodinicurvata fenggangensis]